MEIRRGKAERRQWAGGDLTLWWSKLGDYMLVAPHCLVLLQGPNCSAILSFPRSVVKARCRCMLQCNCSYHLSRSSNSGNMVEKIKYGWLLPDITGYSLFRIRRWSVGAFRQLWWIMSHIWLFFWFSHNKGLLFVSWRFLTTMLMKFPHHLCQQLIWIR